MEAEKVQEVIQLYRREFEATGVGKTKYPHGKSLDQSSHSLEHCHAMLDDMDEFLKEGRTDKVFRWLGFIQGVLWAQGLYSLTELTGHNRP